MITVRVLAWISGLVCLGALGYAALWTWHTEKADTLALTKLQVLPDGAGPELYALPPSATRSAAAQYRQPRETKRARSQAGGYRSGWRDRPNSEPTWHAHCRGVVHRVAEINRVNASRKPVVWRCGACKNGLGDRLKGIMAAFMLSTILGRPFLVEPTSAMRQRRYGVEPALVDWRHGFTAFNQSRTGQHLVRGHKASSLLQMRQILDETNSVESLDITPPDKAILQPFITDVMGLNASILNTEVYLPQYSDDDSSLISHAFRALVAHATFCATRALFRPTAAILDVIETSVLLNLPDSSTFLLGLHVRYGGLWQDRVRASDVDARRIVECAFNMSHARTSVAGLLAPSKIVWLMASDQLERLQAGVAAFAKQRGEDWDNLSIETRTSASFGKVEHVAKSSSGEDEGALDRLWLDWFLMGEVHACTFVRSSFPRTACYASVRRQASSGLVQQSVTSVDLGRYAQTIPNCNTWALSASRAGVQQL